MSYFRKLALFRKLLEDVIVSLKYFFIVFAIIIVMFAVPFLMLTRTDKHEDASYDYLDSWEFYKPYLSLYLATIGDYGFAMDHFEVQDETNNGQ
jgi:hypothetical protein